MNKERIGLRLKSLYIEGGLFINRMLGLPAQTKEEIRIFKAIFDNFITGTKKIKIFEWGSGFSTIYYARYLRKKNVTFEWHSLDNNKSWYEKIKSEMKKKGLQSSLRLYLKEFVPFWEKPGWETVPFPCGVFGPTSESERGYINFPLLLNEKFDLVIVDGRFRRRCLQTAREVLSPNGIVILDDAQKPRYHTGLDGFRYSKFLVSGSWHPFQKVSNKIWIGSMDNSKIFYTNL